MEIKPLAFCAERDGKIAMITGEETFLPMFQIPRIMTDQDKRHDIVEERLRSWLAGDEEGIRHAMLRIFLSHNDLSIQEIYDKLSLSFKTSYHSVSGMIGIVSSRIGVLKGTRSEQHRCRIYRLRDKHTPIVRRIISSRRQRAEQTTSSDTHQKHFFPHRLTCLEDV